MADPQVIHDTFSLTRRYPAAPARVFSAFADPALKRRWFAESDHHDVLAFELDFRAGGLERVRYRMNETTPFPGATLESAGLFLDILADRRVVLAQTMDFGDRRISAALVTFEIVGADKETELVLTHQAAFFEGADGPQLRMEGWRALMARLGAELERA